MNQTSNIYPKRKYLIQISDEWLAVLLRYWINGGKPCSLLIRKPETEGLTAVIVNVETNEAADFILKTKEFTNIRIYEYD